MEITKQQQTILQAVQQHKYIKINAFAGTGKTTTLKLIAHQYKEKKILYLAFNSAIKNEASGIFPSNTHIKTTHGLAFAAIQKYTTMDLSKLVNYRAIDISKEFQITYNQAIGALKIFENFCNSTKREITKDDVEHTTAKKIFDWILLGKLKPTHSFYLKYYYLLLISEQIPQFHYDICMLDEAQDTNEVTLGIFEALNGKVKIYVGDQHQQIYSFRGSKNALSKIKCDIKLYLSHSFRFNQEIAQYANSLLQNFKNESILIEASKNHDDVIETSGYVSRTNAQLIAIISQRIEQKKPFVTVRDPQEIFHLTQEVYYLLENKKDQIQKNRFLKDFQNEEEIVEYAKEVEDFELRSALKIAKEYKEKIFEFKDIAMKFYKAWQNRNNNGFCNRQNEILFLTTAHTAKGLEWDRVTIADDFTDFADLIVDFGCESLKEFLTDQNHLPNQELIDEFNLFYVAITRAKKILLKDSENFHYLMAKDVHKLVDSRIKEAKANLEAVKSGKKQKISKMEAEDKLLIRQQKNVEEGKAKNAGLKWSLEEKIQAQSMYKKGKSIVEIASKLERTTGSILGELHKSEIITKTEQMELSELLKTDPSNARKKGV